MKLPGRVVGERPQFLAAREIEDAQCVAHLFVAVQQVDVSAKDSWPAETGGQRERPEHFRTFLRPGPQQSLLLGGMVSSRTIQPRPVGRDDGGERQRDQDRNELGGTLHRYNSKCPAIGEACLLSQLDFTRRSDYRAASGVLAYSFTNQTRLRITSRRFRQTSRPRCLYHCCHDDTFSASSSAHAPYSKHAKAAVPPRAPGRRIREIRAVPEKTRLSSRPAHWRSDGSPIGSRRTPPTTGRSSSGFRAPTPSASRE